MLLVYFKTGAIFQLDAATSALLEYEGQDINIAASQMERKYSMSRDEFNRTVQEFHDVQLMGDHAVQETWEYSFEYLRGIELMVCQCCNLACKYCYAQEGEYSNPGWMSEETGRSAIDFLFSHSTSPTVAVSFLEGNHYSTLS